MAEQTLAESNNASRIEQGILAVVAIGVSAGGDLQVLETVLGKPFMTIELSYMICQQLGA